MTKCLLMLAVCMGLVLSVTAMGAAKPKTSTKSAKTVDGIIKTVNRTILIIETTDSNGALDYSITPATTVTIGGKQGTIQDLAHGQSVTVALNGKKVTSVTVNALPAKAD